MTKPTQPAYEDVPMVEDPTGTLEEAAKVAGLGVATFKAYMTRLNNTEHDLRAPRVPGERARRYYLSKTKAWANAGHPKPDPSKAKPARTITARAEVIDGNWSGQFTDPAMALMATDRWASRSLESLSNTMRKAAAKALGIDPNELHVDLSVLTPDDVAEEVAEHHRAKTAAAEETAKATAAKVAAVNKLRAKWSLTDDDIGRILGLSRQAITQVPDNN